MSSFVAKSAVLQCCNLHVGIQGKPVLATVDASFAAGRFTAILGPNGAGKSTLMALLTGERVPLGGEVRLHDEPLGKHCMQTLARHRAVMPQDCSVAFGFTAAEVVELGRYPHRARPSRHEASIVHAAMQLTGVAHLADRDINTLSGGERARTHLARALAQIWEPPTEDADLTRWLLLDEPTAALDIAHQHHSMQLLRQWAEQQNVGVIAVVHDLNLALRYAHDVVLLSAGACQTGAVRDVLTPQNIARVWRVSCSVAMADDGVPQYLFSAPVATH